jgi:hypothetical protein
MREGISPFWGIFVPQFEKGGVKSKQQNEKYDRQWKKAKTKLA